MEFDSAKTGEKIILDEEVLWEMREEAASAISEMLGEDIEPQDVFVCSSDDPWTPEVKNEYKANVHPNVDEDGICGCCGMSMRGAVN
ncbi:MAG: hypothetical protein ACXABY_00855 [Candidatus Thorarchaeota archaeon]